MASPSGSSSESATQVAQEVGGSAGVQDAIAQLLGHDATGSGPNPTVTVTTAHPGEAIPAKSSVVRYDTSSESTTGDISGAGDAPIIFIQGQGAVKGTFTEDVQKVVVTGEGRADLAFTAGSVTVQGGSGDLHLAALGSGAQSIAGGSGALNVVTGSGPSTIKTGSGDAHITSGSGNDEYYLGAGNATISGGGGHNTAHAAETSSSANVTLDSFGNLVVGDGQGHTAILQDIDVVTFTDGSTVVKASNTNEAVVARMYEAVFGRTPDADGIHFWWDALASGASVTAIAQAFLASAEAATDGLGPTATPSAFVTGLYEHLFNRSPDLDGGGKFWTDALTSHTATPADVLVQLAASTEGEATTGTKILFDHASGSTDPQIPVNVSILPDGSATVTGSTNFDTVSFGSNKSDFVVSTDGGHTTFINTKTGAISVSTNTEYTHFADGGVLITAATADQAVIARMYDAVLGRDAEAGGLKYWWDAHTDGASLHDIAGSFLHSPEYTADHGSLTSSQFVDQMYVSLFGRDPAADPSGHDFWTNLLDNKMTTREDLVVAFAKSAEGVAVTDDSVKIIDTTHH